MKNLLFCLFIFLFVNINSQVYKYNPITKKLDLTGASIGDTSIFNPFYVLKAGDVMTGDLTIKNAHGAANLTLKSDTFGANFFNFEAAAFFSIYPKGYKRVLELNQDYITFNSDSGNFSFNIDNFNQDTAYNYNSTKNKHTYKGNIISRDFIGINIDPIQKIHIHEKLNLSSVIKFTNINTGSTINDGSDIGIDASGNTIIRNNENNEIQFYQNNLISGYFDSNRNLIIDSIFGGNKAKINTRAGEGSYLFRGISQSTGGTGSFISIGRADGINAKFLLNAQPYKGIGEYLFEGYCNGTFRAMAGVECIADGSFNCGSSYGSELKFKNTPANTTDRKTYIKLAANQKTYISGDVTLNNNTVIENDGSLTFEGLATTYEDFNITASELGTGASAPDLIAINGTVLQTRGFDGTATLEQLFGTIEIPHSYKEGSNITPHQHVFKTTAGLATDTAVFQLQYQWVNINDNFLNTVTTIEIKIPLGNVAWKNIPIDFATIIGTGKKISSHFVFRVFRDPAHPSDNYTGDVGLVAIGLHVEQDMTGSRTITAK